jgi:hypothetical protein
MVNFLKYPFGYKAALAISDDCEFMTLGCLSDLIEYFNSKGKTKIGRGLGLEFAGSFFPYSSSPADEIVLFRDELGILKSSNFSKVIHYIKEERIDTLHTYGNFDEASIFDKKLAENTAIALEDAFVKIPVWVNHGNDRNYQNISHRRKGGFYNEFGAVPGCKFFHLDITTKKIGVKYFSTPEFTTINYGLDLNYDKFVFLKNITRAMRLINDINFNQARHLPFYFKKTIIDSLNNETIRPLTVNGVDINFFHRFRSFSKYAPTSKTFHEQISTSYLNNLIKRQGAVIIYQHLGVHRLSDGKVSQNKFPYFNKETFKQLHYLSDLAINDIWVTKTSKLLNYLNYCKHLNFKIENLNNILKIKIESNNFIRDINDLKYFSFEINQKYREDVFFEFNGENISKSRIYKKDKIMTII